MNAAELDKRDVLSTARDKFHIPRRDGRELLYLCGNSLGLQPKTSRTLVDEVMRVWEEYGVDGHLEGKRPWYPYHEFLTEQMAEIAGSSPEEVVVMNSLTVNLHLLMATFYRPKGKKNKILIEKSAFPSDQYAVASQARFHGLNSEECILELPWSQEKNYTTSEDTCQYIREHAEELALIMLGGVNYYSGAVFDFEKITAVAREHGIFIGFDMAHAAGNVKMNLSEAGPDFACWCTYKYLNAGPGSLSGIYINQRHLGKRDIPRFEGWWGHDKHERFKMKKKFRPMATAEAWQLSNPPILPMACIKASLDIFSEAGMANVAKKGKKLSGFLIEKLDALESRKVEIISPRDEQYRGAQVSIRVKNADKSLFDRMTEAGIVADWREPDVIRVAPCALYNTFEEVERFVAIFADCLQSKTISHEK